jgi:hypothetical protein
VLAVYAVFSVIALRDTKRLQEEFAYISLKDRLPSLSTPRPAAPLPSATRGRLNHLEDRFEEENRNWLHHRRTDILRAIHEDTVRIFVDQSGFGVTRMGGMNEWLLRRVRPGEPIPQPGPLSPSPWVSMPDQSREAATEGLHSLHEASVLDYANPANFGFIKDRQHVAGFVEHQITQMPAPPKRWSLQRLDLIGLIVHKEPVAYVSEDLPRMDELRAAPRRSLDDFESAGLSALRCGEDLYANEGGTECRMLGAIRAVRQCLACHDGEHGDLLTLLAHPHQVSP